MGSELVGEDFFDYPMQSEESGETKPGRPQAIDAKALRRNVVEIQFALEQNWGEVGWLLHEAKTEADVRNAFKKIVNPRCNLLGPFTRDHTLCTETNIRELRKRVEELGKQHGRLFADLQQTQSTCERAFNALVVEPDSFKRAEIQAARAAFLRDYEETALLEEKNRMEWEALRAELGLCEAHFAQSEILKHLQSNRRRFTPLNVACAIAGLPLITARVSSENCTEHGINPPHGMAFDMFRTIQRVLKEPIRDLGRAIESLRIDLVNGADKNLPHTTELRKNWYFLESAIRLAGRDSSARFGSLPFRVFAEYTKITTSHSAAEDLLAEVQRL